MQDNLLKVRFFQEFSLQFNNQMLIEGRTKSSKVYLLLQYFLANRTKHFTKEHLMDLLYEEEETDNPVNALKIIIYRLRKQLVTLGLPDDDYILNRDGKYYWNTEIPCEVDVESFHAAIAMAGEKDLSDEEKLEHLITALNIYSGDFLGHNSVESWVVPTRVHYQELYMKVLKNVFTLIKKKKDNLMLYHIATHASEIYPHDEDIAYEKIAALHSIGKTKEAIQEYNRIVDLIFDEFGVAPSNELKELFNKISASTQKNTESVTEIKRFLDDGETEGGAYYCNLQNFADSYRFMVRGLERSGLSVFLMLCTVVNKQGKPLESDELLKEASDALRNASRQALRRGDLYTRYSASQYLYLLVGINQENCTLVFQRVETQFKKETKGNPVSVNYKVISAADIATLFK